MNITQAKQLPLRELVEHFGGRYSHAGRTDEFWFFSPFRSGESTASFKIDEINNSWHDFGQTSSAGGQGSGGDIINLWCDFHQHDRKDVKPALQWLESFSGRVTTNNAPKRTQPQKNPQQTASQNTLSRFKLVKAPSKIYYDSLKAELHQRGITQATALPFLKQAQIIDSQTKKKYYGFAFANAKQGWEISIPNPQKKSSFKTALDKNPYLYPSPCSNTNRNF